MLLRVWKSAACAVTSAQWGIRKGDVLEDSRAMERRSPTPRSFHTPPGRSTKDKNFPPAEALKCWVSVIANEPISQLAHSTSTMETNKLRNFRMMIKQVNKP